MLSAHAIVKLADYERWRIALGDGGHSLANRCIRELERELARKETGPSRSGALLVLKKTIESRFSDADDDTDVWEGK